MESFVIGGLNGIFWGYVGFRNNWSFTRTLTVSLLTVIPLSLVYFLAGR
jgi:hypothetical protein